MATKQPSTCGDGMMGNVSCMRYITELLSHNEELAASHEETFKTRLDGMDEARRLAAENLQLKLEGLNSLREQVNKREVELNTEFVRISTFNMSQEKTEGTLSRVEDRINTLELSKERLAGKASMTSVFVSYIIAVVSLAIAALSLWR